MGSCWLQVRLTGPFQALHFPRPIPANWLLGQEAHVILSGPSFDVHAKEFRDKVFLVRIDAYPGDMPLQSAIQAVII